MTPQQLLAVLQLSDTLFPTGGFAYSDGLETAVSNGQVTQVAELEKWMRTYIQNVFAPCDGLALLQAMRAYQNGDWGFLDDIDEELTAMKPAAAVRTSSKSMGKSFLKSVGAIHPHPDFERVGKELENLPVIYGVVASVLGFSSKDALLAFAYIRLAGSASASLRLMSIGQQQAQTVLHRVLETVPGIVEHIMNSGEQTIACFSPLMDIQQMNHRYVYSRLFRS